MNTADMTSRIPRSVCGWSWHRRVIASRGRRARKRAAAGEARLRAQGLFDAQRFVPLRHALAAGERADLELARVPAHREVHDGHVLGLARARRHDGAEPGALARVQRGARLGDGAGLIRLDQHGVAGLVCGGLAHQRGVGDQVVVADDLDAVAERGGERAACLPGRPRRADPRSTRSDSAGTTRSACRPSRRCRARARRAPADSDRRGRTPRRRCPARCRLPRRAGSRRPRWRAPASRAHPRCCRTPATTRLRPPRPASLPSLLHQPARCAVDLGGHHERLVEARRRQRHHHQVLDVEAAAGVRAAAEDLDLRQRQA